MSGGQEFDVAEYSLSEFTQRFTRNECPFVAIPVFPSIAFRMGYIAINKKSGIKTPKDLEGKRIGVPLYTMTAAIFINGILHHEFGVDLTKVKWVQSAMNDGGFARPSDRAAAAEENVDREQHLEKDAGPDAGRRRDRRHAGHQPAGGNPHQS